MRGNAPAPRFGGASVQIGEASLPLAPVGKRIGALLVDGLIIAATLYGMFFVVLFVAIGAAVGSDPGEPIEDPSARLFVGGMFGVWVLAMMLQWLLDGFGWSPGKAATSVRLVRLDGRRPGAVHGLVRFSTRSLSFLALGLGYFWALWDERNQTWHDKLAGTVVVRAPALDEQIPDRRAEPLVTTARVWWLSGFGALLLTASVAVSVWAVANTDGALFDADPYGPYRFDDQQRIESTGPIALPIPFTVATRISGRFTPESASSAVRRCQRCGVSYPSSPRTSSI